MTQYSFTTESFNQSLVRARAREAAEIAAAAAGISPKQSGCPMLLVERLAKERSQRALCGLA
jgi:hypothetical protein